MADKQEPNNNLIALFGIIIGVVLFVLCVIMVVYFQWIAQKKIHATVELAPTVAIRELHQWEANQLHMVSWADEGRTQVRIPIELAMELEARDSWRNHVTINPSTPPVTAETAASATEDGGETSAPETAPVAGGNDESPTDDSTDAAPAAAAQQTQDEPTSPTL